jgi:WD40 repeat protein
MAPRTSRLSGRDRLKRVWTTGLKVAALLVTAAVLAAVLTGNDQAIAVAALVVATLTLIAEAWFLPAETSISPETTPDGLADDLASVVRTEWQEEAQARRLRDPRLLPLAWTQTGRDVVDTPEAVVGDGVPAGSRLRLDGRMSGDLDSAGRDLARSFARIPSGRLVVLGEPGAGKTVIALMITLGLLDDRRPGDPVPVLLSASSWDPISESMDEWIVHGLGGAYYNGRSETPALLLRHHLLLPVIDGLDEIPEAQRRSAIRSINQAVRGDRPVVVTCRAIEYEDLIQSGAPVLRRAPVIEVLPIRSQDTVRYLDNLLWPPGTAWDDVSRHLAVRPASPLSSALSTPLMVSVARTVYQRLGGDPTELLSDGFDSRHAIEDFLTDRVVEAAYAPAAPDLGEPVVPTAVADRWDAVSARRWLTFMAEYLHCYRERDFTWWLLSQRLLSPWVGPALGIGGGVLMMISIAVWIAVTGGSATPGLSVTIVVGAATGGAFAVLVTLVWYAAAGRSPGRLSFTRAGSGRRLRYGLRNGLAAALIPVVTGLLGLAATITVSNSWSTRNTELFLEGTAVAVAVSAVIGLSLALHSWLDAPPRAAAKASPLDFMRQDRRSAWLGSIAAGGVVAVLTLPGVVCGAVVGSVTAKLASGWAGWPEASEFTRLARAESHDVTLGIFGSPILLAGGAVLLPAVIISCLVFLTRAWPRFILTRLLLAGSGRLPWNLPAFLADARARDLLRQSGGAYQFRHIRLQEHLANHALNRTEPLYQTVWSRPAARRVAVVAATCSVALTVTALAMVTPDGSRMTLANPHGAGPYRTAISNDGLLLASAGPATGTVHLWELRTGRLRMTLATGRGRLIRLNFTPDGRRLLIDVGKGVAEDDDEDVETRVFATDTGRILAADLGDVTVLGHGRVLAISNGDDQRGVEESLRLVDSEVPDSGRLLAGAELNTESGTRFITDGPKASLRLWNADTGTLIKELNPAGQTIISSGLTSETGIVYAETKTVTHLWSARSGAWIADLPADADSEFTVSDDGARAASITRSEPGGSENSLTVWATATGRRLAVVKPLLNGESYARATFSADGRWVMGSISPADSEEESETLVASTLTGAVVARRPESQVRFVETSRGVTDTLVGENYNDGTEDRTVTVLDLPSGAVRFTLPADRSGGADSEVQQSDVTDDGQAVLSRTAGGRLTLTDLRTGAELVTLAQIEYTPTYSDFSPDGYTLITTRGDQVELWQARTGRPMGSLYSLRGKPFHDTSTNEESNNHVAGITDDEYGSTNNWIHQISSKGDYLFSEDGRWLLTAAPGDEDAQLWDTHTAGLVDTLSGHSGALHAIGFLPDNRTAVTVGRSDDTVRLWDIPGS